MRKSLFDKMYGWRSQAKIRISKMVIQKDKQQVEQALRSTELFFEKSRTDEACKAYIERMTNVLALLPNGNYGQNTVKIRKLIA